MGLGKSIKRSFWRGLAALLPTLLTFLVLVFGIQMVQSYIGQYVNEIIIRLMASGLGWTYDDTAKFYSDHLMGWLGIVVAIVLLCAAAYIVGTIIGGRLVRLLENAIIHLPIVRKIYPGAKQVSEFFFSERALEFRRVVAVEFPRKGMWMVGFVTGRGLAAISKRAGTETLSIFIPFTPAPITGYVVMVPRDDVTDLDLTVDEAIQFMISAGVIMPVAERGGLPAAVNVGHVEPGAANQSGTEAPASQDGAPTSK